MQSTQYLAGLCFGAVLEILCMSTLWVVCSWESGSVQFYFHFMALCRAVESLTQESLHL